MDARRLIPSDYISSADFGGRDHTFTIDRVERITFEGDKAAKQTKGLVMFQNEAKRWVVNKTNAECLRLMFGNETNDWAGKRVTLFAAPHRDTLTKEDTTAIRVRGSPDLAASKSITFRLGRKGVQTMTMEKTGAETKNTSQRTPELEAEAIRKIIAAMEPAKADDAWNSNKLGARLARLPTELAEELTNEFKMKRKGATL